MIPPARLAAALLLLTVAAAPASAQEQAAPAPAPAEAEATGPYPLGELTLQAEETRGKLGPMAKRLEPNEAVQAIAQSLPAWARLVRDEAADTRGDLEQGNVSIERLEDLERQWAIRHDEGTVWRDRITRRGAEVDREIETLRSLAGRWEATRAVAREANATPTVELVDTTLADIRRVETLAGERGAELLSLSRQMTKIERRAAEILELVSAARTASLDRLLQADDPPLWALKPAADFAETRQRLLEGWQRDWQALVSYLDLRRARFVPQVLMFLAALVGSVALRRRLAPRAAEDPTLRETLVLLRHSVSVAILLSIIGGYWLHPLAPSALATLFSLLLLVPAVRLLPSLVDPPLRPVIYALAAFTLASQIRIAIGSVPALVRLFLTLEVLAGAIFLLWLSRPARLAAIGRSGRVALVVRIALALLALAFVANLFGYFGFAKVLARGVRVAAYSAAVLYGGYRVGSAFVSALLQTETARRLRAVRVGAARIERWTERLLRIGGVVFWLALVLEAFTIREPLLEGVYVLVSAPIEIGSISFSLGDILLFVAVFGSAYLISSFVRFLLQEDVFSRVALRRGVSNALSTTIHYVILFLGLLLALGAAGIDLGRVTLLAGAFGVGIGFGLQNVVNNFVSGLILLFERPIQVGDTIQLAGLLGDVRRIGARSSTVRTFDGAEVIVPNGMLISDQVINWTLSDRRRRITVALGVAYGTDPERVLQLLREVAGESDAVLEAPPPLVVFKGFGDSSLDFELRCWIPRFEEGLSMQTQLLTAIERKLREAEIEIPFPQRDLHVRSVDAAAGRALAAEPEPARPPEPQIRRAPEA